MSPDAIPWILCSVICIIPAAIGTGAFFGWSQFTNRIPTRIVYKFLDDDGREHTVTEWVMLTREEKKFRKQPEEETE
jgi:hypothetical protein